jgi:hypothetical protein
MLPFFAWLQIAGMIEGLIAGEAAEEDENTTG